MQKQTPDKTPGRKFAGMTNSELLDIIGNGNTDSPGASKELFSRLSRRVAGLEKEVLSLSGQNRKGTRKRRIYYYGDVELTDELLVEYIDTEAFTIYELEKTVGAKKNVLRNRYKQAKKRMQALKCRDGK